MAKRLEDINDEFERAVFISLYRSRTQRLRRVAALLVLLIKHALRGLYYIWPVYIVVLAIMLSATLKTYIPYLAALLPGLALWLYIYVSGASKDYSELVRGRILGKGFMKRLV